MPNIRKYLASHAPTILSGAADANGNSLVFSASYNGTLDLSCIRNNESWTGLSDDQRYHDNIKCGFPTGSMILEPTVTWVTTAKKLGDFGPQ
jgi:hypothetical protein